MLAIDTITVNGCNFLVTVSLHLYYRSAHYIPSKTTEQYMAALQEILQIYNDSGFKISEIRSDNEFVSRLKKLKLSNSKVSKNNNIEIVTANPQQYVPEIERNNRFIKEKCRGLFHQTPYHTITKKMLIAMVYKAVTQTNYFPAANGISQYFSPHTIMHKNMVDYKKIKFAFGAYVQAHNKPVQENSMMPRTLCYLKSVDSPYGGHEMLNLPTN